MLKLRDTEFARLPEPSAERVRAPRLSEVLFGNRGLDSFVALPSNLDAVEASLLFSTGHHPFVALVGPSGWGKTHLLEAVVCRVRQEVGCGSCSILQAAEYDALSSRRDPSLPLILDDVQDVLGRNRKRLPLQVALERRVKAGRPTLLAFSSPKPTRAIRGFLPHVHEWHLTAIALPSPQEREVVVRNMAQAENLVLSDELVRVLGHKIQGNGLTLRGAMKRLKLHANRWVGASGTLQACGLLNPYFSDNSSWDLCHHILDCVKSFSHNCRNIAPSDLAVYIMLKEALLSESEVARSTQMEPAQVYQSAMNFEAKLEGCAERRTLVSRFIDDAVAMLAVD